jgi:hypothetical protein
VLVPYEARTTIEDQFSYIEADFAIMRLSYDEHLININKQLKDSADFRAVVPLKLNQF